MTASVVTFSAQLGSDGEAIARAVADRLGYRYYDREIIDEAASLAGVSPEAVANAERWPGFLERMLETMGRATALSDAISGPPAGPAILTLTSADYRGLIEQVVRELAKRGECVIVGHAGQAILKEQKHGVFMVLAHGSADIRAERVARAQSIPLKDALELVKDNDKQRIDFFKHVYDVDWLKSPLYDLTINTDDVDLEAAVSLTITGAVAVH